MSSASGAYRDPTATGDPSVGGARIVTVQRTVPIGWRYVRKTYDGLVIPSVYWSWAVRDGERVNVCLDYRDQPGILTPSQSISFEEAIALRDAISSAIADAEQLRRGAAQ